MTKTNYAALKKKIEEKLIAAGVANPEVILVSGGCLVQAISPNASRITTDTDIFETLVKLHRELPSGESAFPFQIYVYSNREDAFKEHLGLRTKPHDYGDDGYHTTYVMAQDAHAKMREIDVDALKYGEVRPFTFEVMSNLAADPFSIDEDVRYRELEVSGSHYSMENAKLEKLNDNRWRITLGI